MHVAFTLLRGYWPLGLWFKARWGGTKRMFCVVRVDGVQQLVSREGDVTLQAAQCSPEALPTLREVTP